MRSYVQTNVCRYSCLAILLPYVPLPSLFPPPSPCVILPHVPAKQPADASLAPLPLPRRRRPCPRPCPRPSCPRPSCPRRWAPHVARLHRLVLLGHSVLERLLVCLRCEQAGSEVRRRSMVRQESKVRHATQPPDAVYRTPFHLGGHSVDQSQYQLQALQK